MTGLKKSFFINKITTWYFSRKALPYWGILALDSVVIIIAGLFAVYMVVGGGYLASHFWSYILTLVCYLPMFWVGMRVFNTYSGIIRYSSFVDLMRGAR